VLGSLRRLEGRDGPRPRALSKTGCPYASLPSSPPLCGSDPPGYGHEPVSVQGTTPKTSRQAACARAVRSPPGDCPRLLPERLHPSRRARSSLRCDGGVVKVSVNGIGLVAGAAWCARDGVRSDALVWHGSSPAAQALPGCSGEVFDWMLWCAMGARSLCERCPGVLGSTPLISQDVGSMQR